MNIKNVDMPVSVIVNRKLKYIRISIDLKGLKISAPYALKIGDIEKIFMDKEDWILKNYRKLRSIKEQQDSRRHLGEENIFYRGQGFNINVFENAEGKNKASFNGKDFNVYILPEHGQESREEAIRAVLKKLFVDLARDVIDSRLMFYSNLMGVKYNDVRIKEQKTRWGSCSSRGNLNFNWRLISAPDWILDYVIVHELCHIRHPNHSKEFWKMVEAYMPQFKKAREWLKSNGPGLGF